jgi:cell pole-organizing protein PopZ
MQPLPSSPRDVDDTSKLAVGGMFAARTHPSVLPPQPPPAGTIDKSATPGEARTAMLASLQSFETGTPAASAPPLATPIVFDETVPEESLAAEPTIAIETPPAPVAEAKPAVALAAEIASEASVAADELKADAMAKAAPLALNGAAAAKPAPVVMPPARTLEQVVGELLEPVIRHWLENNLPRMVEKVVREEVARAIAADRVAPKAPD